MRHIAAGLTLSTALVVSAPALSQVMSISSPAMSVASTSTNVTPFSALAPQPTKSTRLDFTVWDEALKEMVLYTGPSLRERASRPYPQVGTRLVLGHTSPYRLEGNKVVFEGMDGPFAQVVDSYVTDLVEIGNRIDITSIPRGEQLSYWLNLHNALVIQGINSAYPTTNPSRIKGADGLPFHDSKRVTINGIPLSLKNIREDIVYANWDNPLVIYGFFHGDIGSPSIQRKAYTAETVWETLRFSASEFVGSLRGVEVYRDIPRISRHYEDARPYFFAADFERDIRTHMAGLMDEKLREKFISAQEPIRIASYETDIADMTRGTNNRTQHGYAVTLDFVLNTRPVSSTLAQAIDETMQKMSKVRRRGLLANVTIEDIQTVSEEERLELGEPVAMELPDMNTLETDQPE